MCTCTLVSISGFHEIFGNVSWVTYCSQVAVATFANQGHSILVEGEMCFTERLAYATTQTKAKIRDVLMNIGTPCDNSRSCSLRSTSRYIAGLWKAFDLLESSDRQSQ